MSLITSQKRTLPSGRRSHTKSRNGCAECKQRRIKCDENKPLCLNCTRHSISCHYLHSETTQMGSSKSPQLCNIGSNTKRLPGRPRRVHFSKVVVPPASASPDPAPDLVSCIQWESDRLNFDHLELLHQYSTSTCDTLSADPVVSDIFRVHLPRMGREQPFVMHLLLALAGRHLEFQASTNAQKARYSDLADKQFSMALPVLTRVLAGLSPQNCRIVYISSLLVCWYILARGPTVGDYLIFGVSEPPLFFSLIRGVRSIRQTSGSYGVFDCMPHSTKSAERIPTNDVRTATSNLSVAEWRRFFGELEGLITSSGPSESTEVYRAALSRLEQYYIATYGDGEMKPDDRDSVAQMIFQWVYLLQDDFVDKMRQRKPHALLIVACFAVLIKEFELNECWFLQGWSKHILLGICQLLEEDYLTWMQWPLKAAGVD